MADVTPTSAPLNAGPGDAPPGADRAINGQRPTGEVVRSAVMPLHTDSPAPPVNGNTPTAAAPPVVPLPAQGGAHRPTEPGPTDRPAVSTALRFTMQTVVWSLSIVVTFLAATGQVDFAEWASVTDWRKYLVPAGLELAAIGFMLVGYVRGLRGRSPALCWSIAGVLGGFAVYTNVAHAGPRAGLLFGGFSAVALLLWFVKLAYQYMEHRESTGQASPPAPNFGSLWLLNPRLAWRGLLVAKRIQVSDVETALRYAEVWIAVFDDANRGRARADKIGTRLRRRTAWRTVQVSAGHPVADLPSSAEVQSVSVVDRPTVGPKPTADRRVSGGRRKPTARRRPTARQSRPTDRRQGARPTVTDRPAADTPTDSTDSPRTDSHKPAAVGNARQLRERYGDTLPSEYRVRTDTGWSRDRAQPAIAAYNAGADLTTPEGDPS